MKEIRRKGYKYRIYPNIEQTLLINKTFGSSRKVYNLLLNEKTSIYEMYKDYPDLLKSHTYKTPAFYKTVYPYLKEVDSQALTSAWVNLTNAFNNFFNNSHKHPVYKNKHHSKQSYTSHTTNNNIRLEGNTIKLPKLGYIKLRKHRELPIGAIIKAVIVSRNASGKYCVSLRIEYEEEIVNIDKKYFNIIGLDFSLHN